MSALPLSFDPGFTSRDDLRAAGPVAAWYWLRAVDYSAVMLSGGHIPSEELAGLVSLLGLYREATVGDQAVLSHTREQVARVTHDQLVAVLVAHRLLEETATGVVVCDFARYHHSREQVLELAGKQHTRMLRDRVRKRPRNVSAEGVGAPRNDSAETVSVTAAVAVQQPVKDLQTTVTEQPSVLSLQDQATRAVAAANSDPVGWAVAHLEDADGRTAAAIRSVLRKWDLPESAVAEAMVSLEQKRADGEIFKGDAAYFVGTLNRMGRQSG